MKLPFSLVCALSLTTSGVAQTQTLPLANNPSDAPLPPARLSLPQLGLSADEQLSPAQERVLGRVIWRDLRSEPDVVTDPLVSDYLQNLIHRLGKPLALPEGFAPRAFAINDPTLNAFAMPSGLMGVHAGLILSVAREGELAAVMAHELGHVSQRHFARGLANQKDNAWISLAGFAAALIAVKRGNAQADQVMQGVMAGSQAVQASKQLAFSRDMEREADSVGFALMKEAKYDGSDMVRMLRRLGAASSLNETGTVYARSHPGATERMANIEGRLRIGSASAVSTATGVNLDFLLLQARLRALLATSSEQVDDAKAYFQAQLDTPQHTAQQNAQHSAQRSTPHSAQHSAANRLVAQYGLAVLAIQAKQPAVAASALAAARLIPIAHPWLDVLDFELAAARPSAQPLALAAWLSRYCANAPAAALYAVLIAQKVPARLASGDTDTALACVEQWLASHPQDDQAWGLLAELHTQQDQPALAARAQAEQTAAMGVWASSINLLSSALKLGETTIPVPIQNQWRERLRELRQTVEQEKSLLDKFK